MTDAERDALDRPRLDDPTWVDRIVTDAVRAVDSPAEPAAEPEAPSRPAPNETADGARPSPEPAPPPPPAAAPPSPVIPALEPSPATPAASTDIGQGGSGGDGPEGPDDDDEPTPSRRSRSGLRNVIEWIVVIAGALAVALLIKAFLFQAFFIPSESMEPTLDVGDRVIVNKFSDDYNRGDLIVFEKPASEGGGDVQDLIKRIVALPGETVSVEGNQVYIDANEGDGPQPLDEPYLPDDLDLGADYQGEPVPEGHLFVMGDNRDDSRDSRFFGPIPESDVVGRAFLRVWPPGSIGLL